MNIKSLLLGSAAALAVVSGAHAADAVVAAEPEPVEYVRICDAYGAGYFFIPGTDTCIKFGGYIRTEGAWGNAYAPATQRGTWWHTRNQFSIDTATDTEWGALKTDQTYRFDWNDGGTTGVKLLWGNISLGGFLVGKADSQYSSYLGYAGDVIQDDLIEYGIKSTDELNQLTYTYDSGTGFTALASLEDSNSGTGVKGLDGSDQHDHYAPDAVAGFGYTTKTFGFKVVGGYDSEVEEGAIKARLDATVAGVQAFVMGGWNTDGDKINKYAADNGNGVGWGDWAVWGGVGVPINDKLKWNVQLAYDDMKTFEATTNLKFTPVKGFVIEPEVTYARYDSSTLKDDQVQGEIRFQRNF